METHQQMFVKRDLSVSVSTAKKKKEKKKRESDLLGKRKIEKSFWIFFKLIIQFLLSRESTRQT